MRITRTHQSAAIFIIMLLFTLVVPAAGQGKDTIGSIKGRKKAAAKPKPRPAPVRRSTRSASTPSRRTAIRPIPAKTDPMKLVVSRLGQGQFKTIGEAIRMAKPGSKIVVRPGVYEETVSVDRPVDLSAETGAAEGSTILESAAGSVMTVSSTDCIIRGLSIRARSGLQTKVDFVVDVPKGRAIFQDCDVSGGAKATVLVHGGGTEPVFRRCHIFNGVGTGVFVVAAAKPMF